eukprot:GHVU01177311.1.p2 GENE.GHVU01177311.1~~GHVU01177311.1.p2  ORF type:complete len:118 (+),score=11.87 GHVU01177311.1:103-456(+)
MKAHFRSADIQFNFCSIRGHAWAPRGGRTLACSFEEETHACAHYAELLSVDLLTAGSTYRFTTSPTRTLSSPLLTNRPDSIIEILPILVGVVQVLNQLFKLVEEVLIMRHSSFLERF